jgi:OOP family OmpA-OmpF porin
MLLRRVGLLVLLAGPALVPPASGADRPSLKETLDKVQSESQSKAVEDLIDKLKGGGRKPAAAPPPPPSGPPPPAVASPSNPSPPPAAPESKPPPAAAATPAPPVTPDDAVARAETKEAPSIDLEVFFAYKSAAITPQAAAALTPLGKALSDPRLAGDAFLIAGHTDAKGGADYNLTLSQQRAEAVRQFLITRFKLDGARLVAKGMGPTRLKVPAQPLAAENRRVQIVNLSKSGPR